jgi:hypothetical protein
MAHLTEAHADLDGSSAGTSGLNPSLVMDETEFLSLRDVLCCVDKSVALGWPAQWWMM